MKRKIQDHPQWRDYLDSRHILEPAIAADAWVEREDWSGQDVLVWREKRQDGSPGATRRRLLKQISRNGKSPPKVRWQVAGQKTDEPFHYVGTLDNLKREIARAGGTIYIVEGEIDVWSMHALGISNVIGIYGISNIPKDIGEIFTEHGVASFVYLADNDKAGEIGASNLRTLLHESVWKGEGEYRRVVGPGILEKGDANDLLCHHYPDISAARAALDALPSFEPCIKRKQAPKSFTPTDYNGSGWDAVNETITNELGLIASDFKPDGYTKNNFNCINPQHDDKEASAGWSRDGNYYCFVCGKIHSWQVAEWLGIDWRDLRWPKPQIISSNKVDLDAAPQTGSKAAPLAFERIPDSWLRAFNKLYASTEAQLFFFTFQARSAGALGESFTIQEFIESLRPFGCKLSDRSIYRAFESAAADGNHVLIAKLDPPRESRPRNAKYRLRPLEDIKRRLIHDMRFRVFEDKFRERRDVLIGFEVFDEALQGSSLAIRLKSALEPLYREQKKRFDSLVNHCEGLIAGYVADLDDLSATPLPDWSIDDATDLPAMLARALYDADPQDLGKTKWARLLGIGRSSVPKVMERAGIKRTTYITWKEVNSQREAKVEAKEEGAKIVGVEVGGGYQEYDVAMHIPPGSKVALRPPAKHETISDEKQVVKAPATRRLAPDTDTPGKRADNMKMAGNWYKPCWDPQFIYWELVKACHLLHGYEVEHGFGIYDPRTGEIWPNPTLPEVAALITKQSDVAGPSPG